MLFRQQGNLLRYRKHRLLRYHEHSKHRLLLRYRKHREHRLLRYREHREHCKDRRRGRSCNHRGEHPSFHPRDHLGEGQSLDEERALTSMSRMFDIRGRLISACK